MYAFNYHRPKSVDEAFALLQESKDGQFLAGGQTLIPTLKQRLAQPSDLIDIGQITELAGITEKDGGLVIGAATRHADVAASNTVKSRIPGLAALAEEIGDPAVRHMGTLGGSIANNDPAADYPAACLGLGAAIRTNIREIGADDFFTGMFETALEESELITQVSFPIPEKAGYAKLPNPASRYALVGVFVSKAGQDIRVAVTGAGPCVFRIPEMEAALSKRFTPEALEGITVSADGLNADLYGSAQYRAHLIPVMARRAVSLAA